MPEHMRALIAIILIAWLVFALTMPAITNLLPKKDFERYRNLWIAITLIAFLAHNFWLYIFTSAIVILMAQRNEPNTVALYLALLLAVPPVASQISGLGVIEYLFEINPVRLLELVILLPTFLVLMREKKSLLFGKLLPDQLLACFMIFTIVLQLRATTVTDTMRFGFYTFIDIFLPYYVVSRSLKSIEQFRVAITGLVLASLLLAGVAIFETAKSWLLYSSVNGVLGATDVSISAYLLRDGVLRASGTTGQAIVLGYVMMVAIGFFWFIRNRITHVLTQYSLLAILSCGLYVAISRGPWIGMLVFFILFVLFGQRPLEGLLKLTGGLVLVVALALALPGGDKLINLLPFVGNVDSVNVEYRERLVENGLKVLQKNLFFGSATYLDTPEMQSMRQGQGIIDVVNSYLGIALLYGLFGLSMFIGFFASILWWIVKILRRFKSRKEEHYLLGKVLLSNLAAILFTIYTVSSISFIPVLYWVVAGMGVAYVQLFNPAKT